MKITRFEDDGLVTYHCSTREELRQLLRKWKDEYATNNGMANFDGINLSYAKYCTELDNYETLFDKQQAEYIN